MSLNWCSWTDGQSPLLTCVSATKNANERPTSIVLVPLFLSSRECRSARAPSAFCYLSETEFFSRRSWSNGATADGVCSSLSLSTVLPLCQCNTGSLYCVVVAVTLLDNHATSNLCILVTLKLCHKNIRLGHCHCPSVSNTSKPHISVILSWTLSRT